MKMWQRAAGALKDRNSILVSSLARRTSARNPALEEAIIKATSHDDTGIDYRNVNRVFAWVRASPVTLKPLMYAISMRMGKTHSWIVALKGLMLMHGVFCCKTSAVKWIGRLPFDLSNFQDCHSNPYKIWGFEAFVRAYYAFLDQRSVVFYDKTSKPSEGPLMQELERLQKWQLLLDLLMKIKPQARNVRVILILEAMDCVIIELCETYSRICNGISRVLLNIYSANKTEAALALKVLQKATTQGEQLSVYFELCRDFGVINATDCPNVKKIPEEDILELERIINGVSKKEAEEDGYSTDIVVRGNMELTTRDGLQTIITDKWETFDEDFKVNEGLMIGFYERKITNNPFEISPNNDLLPLVPINVIGAPASKQELPDLISF
ncbi:putative clathrin assembly protein [Tripterygium wilfordii]|uniref:Putative clathrin assembly protein n=1 Tax=Tripterygium wilfordii TaxID=458696 RepID=A0A7J7DUU4_TRIWF|nr:putative clathrin assembly protein At1g25240 [Tripterygium wilfordii]KAF5750061.1 putative clathrin assembly protein [Tripterygium wilfordii]